MTGELIIILGKCIGAALTAILAGFSAVAVFNGMPPKWLTDYGEKPSDELLDRSKPRIQNYPWAYVIGLTLSLVFIRMVMIDYRFFACGVLMMWSLAVISLCDFKYKIIPDQMILLLAVSGIGFIPFVESWKTHFIGLVIGGGAMFVIAIIARLVMGKDAIGGGDVKLFAALGISLGARGIFIVFILTMLITAFHGITLISRKKLALKDALPMAPYVAVAVSIYLAVLWNFQFTLEI
ncbi:prepilin peptidase [Eubacteriales bacterium KG127]